MGLMQRWQQWQEYRARRYLTTHKHLAARVLRQHPDVATAAALSAFQQLDIHAADGPPGRETTPWPILGQLGTGGRRPLTQSLPKPTAFNLRRFSEYPPARRAINRLCNPILDQPWAVDLIPLPGSRKCTPTLAQQIRIDIATRLLTEPNQDDTFRTLVEAVLEDIVVGGFGAIEVQRWRENPLRPVLLYGVDGQSIRINTEWRGEPAEPRYAQSLGYAGITVGTQEAVQLRDDELLYIRLNPRTSTPFGLGYLETAFIAVNAWLGAFEYAERRASNATPNFALFLGENITPQQTRYWQQYWEQQIEGYGKTPILGGGREPKVLPFTTSGEDQLYLKWQEFLIRIIAMAFGLSPFALGLERDVNRSTASEMGSDDWETVAPVANTVADYLTHKLLWRILGWRDLRFHWLVKDQDEKRQAEILTLQNDMDALTLGEIRELYERAPYGDARDKMTKTEYQAWVQAQGMTVTEPAFGGPPGTAPHDEEHDAEGEDAEEFAFTEPAEAGAGSRYWHVTGHTNGVHRNGHSQS